MEPTDSTKQKPVTLLTGFLEAGKTTLLNAYLSFKPQVRFAIIENEIGAEGIDGELIASTQNPMVALNNGCICCTLNDNFYEVLRELYQRKREWDELIIEATGIADPAGVAMPFLVNPAIRRDFRLERIIGLVDPALIEQQLQETEEAPKQVAFSDVLLINKIDQVSASTLDSVRQTLTQINPLARILTGHRGEYPLEELAIFVRTLSEEDLVAVQAHASDTDDHHHSHHHDIRAISFTFTEAFDTKALIHRLNVFLLFQAQGVYRAKGVFYDPEKDTKVVIQAVGKMLMVTPGGRWKPEEDKRSRMVFIGRHLKPAGFERMIRQCALRKSCLASQHKMIWRRSTSNCCSTC